MPAVLSRWVFSWSASETHPSFVNYIISMPNDNSDQDIRRSLARAFDRAWAVYYRPGRQTLSQDIARTELARRLVQLSKAGVRDEKRLTKEALSHLSRLTRIDENTER
jgi:hypothetical protein